MDATVVLGKQGRLVIPAEIRAALRLRPGDRLHLATRGSRLVIEPQGEALTELQALAQDVPPSSSLVDELLQARRAEAGRE
ncbi:AbrB/MazE/SpoVT family DNA-binding domain-containing protein [Nocardioides massiliensis]|uniref:AbrB/MazE/SpoVT family DNA-binding domain-containing protein n=1 Tax=Nocardioides massiliensis TaxID=1325935 RepID=UPI001C670BE5